MKLWTSKQADIKFSLQIRARDKRCRNCGRTEFLQCSHFWSRVHSSTRYDPDNGDTFCAKCHFYFEYRKQGEYRDWKIKQLGLKKYNILEKKARSIMSRQEAIKIFQNDTIK